MDPATLKYIINSVKYPVIMKNICKWPLLNWSLKEWELNLQNKKLHFRGSPQVVSEDPCWERNCPRQTMTFKEFIDKCRKPDDWLYFDYNYLNEWFSTESEIFKQVKWDAYGFPDVGAKESSLWIGSEGAHTPCHQDTYGRNIVLQLYGKKRWLLFPPNADNDMKITRIPYEESSIYSQLNFFYPINLSSFEELSGCRTVVLEPGDALIVPDKWWHYVEHVSPVGITINTWLPGESDTESRVEEAISRTIISQFCKDLPVECLTDILNPNEDDLPCISLDENLKNLGTVIKRTVEYRSKLKNTKKHKTEFEPCSVSHEVIEKVMSGAIDGIAVIPEILKKDFIDLLKGNIERHRSDKCVDDSQRQNVMSDSDNILAFRLLNSLCQPNVVEKIKDNILKDYL